MVEKITKKTLWDWEFWNDNRGFKIYKLDNIFNKSWDNLTNSKDWKIKEQLKEINNFIVENLDKNKNWAVEDIFSNSSFEMFDTNGKFYLNINFYNLEQEQEIIKFEFSIYYLWNNPIKKMWDVLNLELLE